MILEFVLDGGSKIAISADEIASVCELKSKTKAPPKVIIREVNDSDGWEVLDAYEDVVSRWKAATNIIEIDINEAVNDATG